MSAKHLTEGVRGEEDDAKNTPTNLWGVSKSIRWKTSPYPLFTVIASAALKTILSLPALPDAADFYSPKLGPKLVQSWSNFCILKRITGGLEKL